MKVDELLSLIFPFLPWGEYTKKGIFEALPCHGTTSEIPTIISLIVPCLSHVLDFIGSKLSLFNSTHPMSKQDLIELIKEIMEFFINI